MTLEYYGCSVNVTCYFALISSSVQDNPFIDPIIWKRENEQISLSAKPGCEYLWSTGETTIAINVLVPGIYSVTQSNQCGSVTYSVEVRDNVELYRATCDLLTNKNQVTWQTTPEQAEYISAVKVYRNNELVGTVPYTDGSFTDNIGSESTQWQYHLVGVSVESDDCPVPSYWKRTIHLDHIQGAQGDHILQWTPYEEESPAGDDVVAYRIFDVVDGVPTQVIDVGDFTNVYAYNPSDFHGYGAVAAIFAEGRGYDELAFSNLTREKLDVKEQVASRMSIYPNPANGTFTIEGSGTMVIINALGQTSLTREIDGKKTIELSQGMYFVKLGEIVQKVVVE